MSPENTVQEPAPDPRFPVPDRSDHQPQSKADDPEFPELDLAQNQWVMPDGRPAVVEEWLDLRTRHLMRTFFYSTLEIEDWSQAQHFAYIASANGLVGRNKPGESLGISELVDPAGNTLFSITIAISEMADS